MYPLNWEEVFDYIGFPAFLKPHLGGGWKSVYKVDNPQQLYDAYNETGTLGMVYMNQSGKSYVMSVPFAGTTFQFSFSFN